MPKLIISRSSEWVNRLRNIQLIMDGKKLGVIRNGQSQEFDIPAGEHQFHSTIDWCGSPTISFHANDGDTMEVSISSFKHAKWMLPIALLNILIYFIMDIQSTLVLSLQFMINLPIFLALIYYLTWGRREYLRLTQV